MPKIPLIEIAALLSSMGIFAWVWNTRIYCEAEIKKKVDSAICNEIHKNMDKRFEEMKEFMKIQFSSFDKRLDDIHQLLRDRK